MASAHPNTPEAPSRPADQVQRNILAIAQLEKTELGQRPPGERLSGAIAGFAGTLAFVLLHVVGLGAWILANRPESPLRFDPSPFNILNLVLGVETILLATFVLITQNHMLKRADRLAHLNLQISLLAESEMTKMLDTLRTMSLRLGLPDAADDEAFRDLARETSVKSVVQALEERGPAAPTPPAASAKGESHGIE
jgi:uncharacterized membrane protein